MLPVLPVNQYIFFFRIRPRAFREGQTVIKRKVADVIEKNLFFVPWYIVRIHYITPAIALPEPAEIITSLRQYQRLSGVNDSVFQAVEPHHFMDILPDIHTAGHIRPGQCPERVTLGNNVCAKLTVLAGCGIALKKCESRNGQPYY